MRKNLLVILLIGFMVTVFTAQALPAKAKVIALRIANYFPPTAAESKILQRFGQELEKLSNGRIKVRYFAGGSLLKAPRMYEGVLTGIADIGMAHVEYTPGLFPVTEIADLPLGYPSGWVATHVVNDFYNKFKPKEWNKVKVLWMNASGPNVIISKKPVRRMKDLKGMIIRAPGLVGNAIKALGASPAPTPVTEVYDGLATGVIDGASLPYETLKSFRLAEVAKYVTDSWQIGNTYAFYVIMNKNAYNKLPPDLKAVLNKLSGVYEERFALMWNSIDFKGKAFGKKEGVHFIKLSPASVIRWKKAVKPVIGEYVKQLVSRGFPETAVRSWLKFLHDRINYWTKKQIEWDIKSSTGPAEMR